jgi:hypothetical protein
MARTPRKPIRSNLPVDPHVVSVPPTCLTRLWRPRDLARWWGLSRTRIYQLIADGTLKTWTIGGAKHVTEASAHEYELRCQNGGGQ